MSKQLNARYLDILNRLREEEEPYSNRWMTYGRAFDSLRNQKREYLDVKDLKEVKYIGDTVIANIRNFLESSGSRSGGPQTVSLSKRGRSESSTTNTKSSKGRKRMRKSTAEDGHLGENQANPCPSIRNSDLLRPSQSLFDTPTQSTTQSVNLSQPEHWPFKFAFVDPNRLWVLTYDRAEVDIYANIRWYRICFLKTCMQNPLVRLLRLILDSSGTGNIVEAWIQDEHIIQFNLHNAPGLGLPSQNVEEASLADLLSNEKKAKNKTLDPTRHFGIDRDWQVSASHKADVLPKSSIKVAVQPDTTNAAAGPRSLRMPATSASASLPTPPATQTAVQQLLGPVASENAIVGTQTNKVKGKRPKRGRTSEFVPTFSPTDEFDLELEKQSNSQPITAGNPLYAPADLIDDITDLTDRHAKFNEFEPIVFPPGSFEIVLILDNREVKSQDQRDFIANALRRRDINVERRSLALGDVLWIAKCRFPSAAPVNHECVLGYILERKRLDDLCGSIKDGRFREQKFRLANTGLKVFYLIEQFETEKQQEKFGVQIDTARSSTQVVDGFILKETGGLDASIDYLATMHKTIVEMYHNKYLYVIPPNLIKRHSYMALQKHLKQTKPDKPHLTSYECFGRLNDKSANLTTKDIFAQMLLCIKGVSAEKAAVIIDNFPTMRSLWEAFEAADTTERKDRNSKKPLKASEMLCRLGGEGRKHFGPTLSTNIYNLFRK